MTRTLTFLAAALWLAACGTTQSTASAESTAGPSAIRRAPVSALTAGDVAVLAEADTVVTVTTLEAAKAVAQAGGKQILMVFAGSDWCAPCKQFKRSVLDEAVFSEGQKDGVVVLYLDFPSKKRNQLPADQKAYNADMAERYNSEGIFPRIYLLDA